MFSGSIVFVIASLAGASHGGTEAHKAALTFNRDIAPILYEHCASCHHPGEVAPFSLLAYEDAKPRAALISAAIGRRSMPPWKPEPGFGDFTGSRRLTDAVIRAIKEWVEEGAVEGDPRDLPVPPRFARGWTLGKPDLVLKMSKPFEVPPGGHDVYRCFALPTAFVEDKYVLAFELRPSDRKVVHHAVLVQDIHGAARRLEGAAGAGYSCFGGFGFPAPGYVGFWTPGTVPRREPEGVAKVLKKGADLVLQIHFHPTDKPGQEQSEVGIYLSQQPQKKVPTDLTLGTYDIDIPAGERNFKVTNFSYVPGDVEALSIIPHAHLLAREIKASATLPDGTIKPLIWIRDWDFNWQQQYWYASPVRLPQGTRLDMEFTYDNSADSPRNPNHPPQRVTWGEQTTDEMAEIHLEVVPAEKIGAGGKQDVQK